MTLEFLYTLVTLLVILSIASERLVEIIKGIVPLLSKEELDDPVVEGRRRAALQFLAILAGMLTAFLARDLLPKENFPDKNLAWPALGLLASGGSAFWNAILSYLTKIKEIKTADADKKKLQVSAEKSALKAEAHSKKAQPEAIV